MSDTPQGEGWWQAEDGKYYPPYPFPAQPPHMPAPSPPAEQKSNNGCLWAVLIVAGVLTGLAVLGGAILALVGREVAKEIERQSSEADPDDYDLDITSCEIESDLVNWPTLRGNLKNTSSERQGFTIVIDVTAGGEPVAREEHLIPGLSPGQIAIVRVGLAEAELRPDEEFECEVAQVNYNVF